MPFWSAHRRDRDEELRTELEAFEDLLVAEETSRGSSERDARRIAALRLGGRTQIAEQTREQWRGARWSTWWMDARLATRSIWNRPALLAASALTLAIGFGANAAVLSIAWTMWLRALPFPNPERLAVISEGFTDGTDMQISARNVNEWIARLRTVDGIAAYRRTELTIRGAGEPYVVPVCLVTPEFFRILGANSAWDSGLSNGSSAVVSARFAASLPADIVNGITPLGVSDRAYTVVGIVADALQFPAADVMVWLPADLASTTDTSGYYRLIARLKPLTTIPQLAEDAARVMREIGGSTRNHPVVTRLDESIRGQARPLVRAATIGAALLLLVACANVINLFIADVMARRAEYATQLALGAPTYRLFRRVVIEMLWVAGCGAGIGLAFGWIALRTFVRGAEGVLPGMTAVTLDAPVTVVMLLITLVVAVSCGLIPVWIAMRSGASIAQSLERLRSGSHARAAMMVGQIAVSVALLAAAGLLAKTVRLLIHTDSGIEPSNAIAVKLVLTDVPIIKDAGAVRIVDGIVSTALSLPSVTAAGVGTLLPPRKPPLTIGIRYVGDGRNEFRFFKLGSGTPGYLTALGARFMRGRDFTNADAKVENGVAVISEMAARHLFGSADPIGRPINRLPPLAGATQPTVIGVVADVKYDGLDEPVAGAIYVPWSRLATGTTYLVARTKADPLRIATALRQSVREAAPLAAVPEMLTLENAMWDSTAERRLRTTPVLALAGMSVLITFVGLFGMSQRMALERRRELAIRAAVGASPMQIASLLGRNAVAILAVGLTLGCGLAWGVGRMLAGLLYGVTPADPAVLVVAISAVAAGGLVACSVPGRRASRLEPVVDLR